MRRIKHIWLLVFLILLPQVQGQYYSSGSKKAIKRFQEARRCFETGDLSCTEEALLKTIKADKQFIEAYQMLAQICFDQGRLEEAIHWYSTTLEIDPEGNPEGYRLLAGLVLYSGDYERSLGLIEHYLDFPPQKVKNSVKGEALRQKCLFALDAVKNPVPFNPEVSPFGWQRPDDAVSIVTVNGEATYLIRGTWSEDTTSNPPLDPSDAEWDYDSYLTLYFDFDLSQDERIGVMIRALVFSSEWITTSEMVKIAESLRQVD